MEFEGYSQGVSQGVSRGICEVEAPSNYTQRCTPSLVVPFPCREAKDDSKDCMKNVYVSQPFITPDGHVDDLISSPLPLPFSVGVWVGAVWWNYFRLCAFLP